MQLQGQSASVTDAVGALIVWFAKPPFQCLCLLRGRCDNRMDVVSVAFVACRCVVRGDIGDVITGRSLC